jgi:hypothetical protein
MSPKRTDANQSEIVAGLRQFGASVKDFHEVKGCFDILAGYRGIDYKFEIKTESGKLTTAEIEFQKSWRGSPVYIVHSIEEAIAILCDYSED